MLTNNTFISLAISGHETHQMTENHEHYFNQFHKDSVFRVKLARNAWEKVSLGAIIALNLGLIGYITKDIANDTNHSGPPYK